MSAYAVFYRGEVEVEKDSLRRKHPEGDYPSAYEEHEQGTCIFCDAIRELEAE